MNDSMTRANAPPPPHPLTPEEIRAYLEYALDGLATRRAEIITALTAALDAYPRIENDEVLGEIAENVAMARKMFKTAEDRRKEHKAPFLAGERAVDGWFKAFRAPLDTPLDLLQQRMNDYGRRKLAQSKAAAEAEFRRAKQQAELAAQLAAAAMQEQPEMAEQRLAEAAAMAGEMDRAEARMDAKPADHTRVTGTYGATASLRQYWHWRVIDEAKVPRAFLRVDPDLIKAAVKAGPRASDGQPLIRIGGIEFFAEQSMGIRG